MRLPAPIEADLLEDKVIAVARRDLIHHQIGFRQCGRFAKLKAERVIKLCG